MASAKVLHCVGAWLVEHQPDKRKTAEHLAWCRTASSLCCLGRLSEPLQQKLSYPVQRLRAKHAEDQAAEQRALCLAAKAELQELRRHFAFQLSEGQERARVELTTHFAFGLKEIQDVLTTSLMESCNAFCSSRQRSGGCPWPYRTNRGCKKAVRFCETVRWWKKEGERGRGEDSQKNILTSGLLLL